MLKAICERIDDRLDALKISAREASIRAGLHPEAIRNIRRGVQNGYAGVSTRTIAALAPVLGTTSAWLLEGSEDIAGDALPFLDWKWTGALADPDAPLDTSRRLGEPFGHWPAGYFATRAPDDAMNRHSPAGSYLIVDRNDRTLVDGRSYLGLLDGQVIFRRWAHAPARAEPVSTDGSYKIEFLSAERHWEIIGRVKRSMVDL